MPVVGQKQMKQRAIPFVFAIAAITLQIGCSSSHPTDDELIELYHSKKQTFETIVGMIREDDTMIRIDPKFTKATGHVDESYQHWIEDQKITESRWNEYKRLFREIGAQSGITAGEDRKSLSFLISTEGLSIGGSAKGISYLVVPPRHILDSLDAPERPGMTGTNYRSIEGNWYIFYTWTN